MAKKKVLSLEERLEKTLIPIEEQPYKIPNNWEWAKLKELVEIQTGKKDANYGTEDGQYLFFTCAYRPILSPTYSFDTEAILLPGNGANVGHVMKYSGKFEAYQRTYVVDKFKGELDYLYNHMKYNWRAVNEQKQYGSATNYIKLGNIEKYLISLPPLEEQKRIISKLNKMLSKTNRAKELILEAKEAFELRRASILHQAFTGKITQKWREENKINLKSWEETKLQNVVENFKYGISEKSDSKFNGIPVIRIPNIVSNEFNNKDMKYLSHFDVNENNKVIKDDILIIRSNGSKNIVGKCALIEKIDTVHSFASYLIRIRPNNIDPKYLLYLLNSLEVRKQFFKKSKSSAGIHNINSKELGSLNIPLPCEIEQKEIVKRVEEMLKVEEKAKELLDMENQIYLLEKSILSKAFRGELGTSDPNDEPAMELLKRVLGEQE